jgi:hypothetical protein
MYAIFLQHLVEQRNILLRYNKWTFYAVRIYKHEWEKHLQDMTRVWRVARGFASPAMTSRCIVFQGVGVKLQGSCMASFLSAVLDRWQSNFCHNRSFWGNLFGFYFCLRMLDHILKTFFTRLWKLTILHFWRRFWYFKFLVWIRVQTGDKMIKWISHWTTYLYPEGAKRVGEFLRLVTFSINRGETGQSKGRVIALLGDWSGFSLEKIYT